MGSRSTHGRPLRSAMLRPRCNTLFIMCANSDGGERFCKRGQPEGDMEPRVRPNGPDSPEASKSLRFQMIPNNLKDGVRDRLEGVQVSG
jgi:hypothetical protein